MSAVATTIAAYRAGLAAAAPLADAELDELADHLRDAIDAGVAAGTPEPDAIAAALDRVGPPAGLARECARVRSGFAARLSPVRAWSAALLLTAGAMLWWWVSPADAFRMVVIGGPLVVALAARRTWARAVTLGHAVPACVFLVIPWLATAYDPRVLGALVATLGAAVLTAPWRRGELTRAGWGLVLFTVAFTCASRSDVADTAVAVIAPIPAVLAILGAVLRARWACLFGAVTGVLLGIVATVTIFELGWDVPDHADAVTVVLNVLYVGLLFAGAAAAMVAAALTWPSTRRFGDTRGLTA